MTNFLSWSKIDWKSLEEITLELVKHEVAGVDFSMYLKQGNDQEGIDIKSSILDNGSIICVQVKNVPRLDEAALNNIMALFLQKNFAADTSRFILSTTADLQTKKIQKFLHQKSLELQDKQGILFLYWDINDLNQKLKSHYPLVQKFFGQQEANNHCYHQARPLAITPREPVLDFLYRTVRPFHERGDDNLFERRWFRNPNESIDFVKFFIDPQRGQAKHVCLIGDAHQGKSVLLKQSAYTLEHVPNAFISLLIELKSQPQMSIEDMLSTEFGTWKEIPARNLVVFIDGLDEVQTDWFASAVREIAAFCKRNPNTNLVVSCRKNFYYDFGVKEIFDSAFQFFELDPLTPNQVTKYLMNRIGQRYDEFMRYVENAQLGSLLFEPFYLMRLIEQFDVAPNERPQSKFAVIEKVIADSFDHNKYRRLAGGRPAHQMAYEFKEVAKKLAFAMQLAGTNAMPDEDIQILFTQIQGELLQHSNVVAKHNDKWVFTNSLFQEHLAAAVLARLPFEKILNLITVGQKRRKFKTRWLETAGSLLYLVDDENFRNQLIQVIEEDNIELLVRTENSRFSPRLKLDILERLISHYRKFDLQPFSIDEGTIASFIQNVPKAISLFISCLNDSSGLNSVKITAARVLKRTTITSEQGTAILGAFEAELKVSTSPYCMNQMLEMLAVHKLGNIELIQRLTEHVQLNDDHYFRDGLYQLIVAKKCVDQFFPYFIAGLPVLVKHNAEITMGGSELSFEEGVASITTSKNLVLFLKAATEESFLNFYAHSFGKERVLKKVFKKAAKIFEKDPLIIVPILEFVKALERSFLREEYREVNLFFDTVNAGWWAVRLLTSELLCGEGFELGILVNEDSISYLLFEFEETNAKPDVLTRIYHGLIHGGKAEVAEAFMQAANAACEGRLFETEHSDETRRVWEFEAEIRQNDLRVIQSRENLRNGIIDFFNAFGRDAIPENDLYIDWDGPDLRKKAMSNYIYELLRGWTREDKKVYLNDVLKVPDEPNRFERFLAEKILRNTHRTDVEEDAFRRLALQIYQPGIDKAEFENSIADVVNADGSFNETFRWNERLLGKLFLKYEFHTPVDVLMQMVWIDTDTGIYGLEPSYGNNRKQLAQLILEKLNEEEKRTFGGLVLSNMTRGINSSRVLATHIGICKHLKVYAACPFIFDLIKKGTTAVSQHTLLNVYLRLGGNKEDLLDVFDTLTDYNSYDYIEFVSKLFDSHSCELRPSLERCFRHDQTDEKTKTTVAFYLSALGSHEAFAYLADLLIRCRLDIDRIPGNVNVTVIDTNFALDKLAAGIQLLLVPNKGGMRHSELPGNILADWLLKFAQKSEVDLTLVENLLLKKEEEYKGSFDNHRLLFWYAFRAAEGFRNSAKETKSIADIKEILRSIDEPTL